MKKIVHAKLIGAVVALCAAVAVLCGAVFAWFATVTNPKVDRIGMSVVGSNCTAELKWVKDCDRDGTPDIPGDPAMLIEYEADVNGAGSVIPGQTIIYELKVTSSEIADDKDIKIRLTFGDVTVIGEPKPLNWYMLLKVESRVITDAGAIDIAKELMGEDASKSCNGAFTAKYAKRGILFCFRLEKRANVPDTFKWRDLNDNSGLPKIHFSVSA